MELIAAHICQHNAFGTAIILNKFSCCLLSHISEVINKCNTIVKCTINYLSKRYLNLTLNYGYYSNFKWMFLIRNIHFHLYMFILNPFLQHYPNYKTQFAKINIVILKKIRKVKELFYIETMSH